MSSRKHAVRAVHDYDLEEFLKDLGLLEAIEKGELKCSVCGSTINKDNFQCAYTLKEQIQVCCDKLECFEEVLNRRMKERVA